VEIATSRGSGPGGQNRNKIESCVTATHVPTGLSVRIDMKSQHQSKAMALKVLAGRLYQLEREKADAARAAERAQQMGSGMRGDKIRTYRTQEDQVTDHRTEQKWNLTKWLRGDW
jgi:peptide chain release factor 1